MLPVDDAQFDGLATTAFVICGVGFTVTLIVDGEDKQLPVTEVAVTIYAPLTAAVALGMVGL